MCDTEDHCHFHFKTIGEGHLVERYLPYRVDSEWKYTVAKVLNRTAILALDYCVATAKQT